MASNNVIRIPESEKAFEDRIAILFACVVNDENLKGVAARGKKQDGLDLIGTRDRDPTQPVGIQCKLKTKQAKLLASEAERDIRQALSIEPALAEIYVATTAEDDIELDKLALRLRQEQLLLGRKVTIDIWGWTELQRRIRRYAEALQAFDPDYSASTNQIIAIGKETLTTVQSGFGQMDANHAEVMGALHSLMAGVADPGKGLAVEKLLDEQVDEYRHLLNTGKPKTALDLLKRMEARLPETASGAIRSRIQANIGFAHMRLGDEAASATALLQAYDLNQTDAKAKANRILALIFRQQPELAIDEAKAVLLADPSNAAAGAYAYQAALSVNGFDPDDFVPSPLLTDENVAINRTNLLRSRDHPTWRLACRTLFEDHPDSEMAKRFAAEALLDEAYEHRKQLSKLTHVERREMLRRGALLLQEHWDVVRQFENADEEPWLSVGINLITAYRALQDVDSAKRTIAQAEAISAADPALLTASAQFDVICNKPDVAIEKIMPLEDDPHRTLVLAMAYADLDRWQDLVDLLTPERRQAVREIDRRLIDMVLARARIELGVTPDPDAELTALIEQWPDDVTILIAAAGIAADRRLSSADNRIVTAEGALDQLTLFNDRATLAQIALRRDDYALMARVLDGFVDTTEASEPLMWLALAFANAPLRPRSHEFFEQLPSDILETAAFSRLAAAVEMRRGLLPKAESYLRRAVAEDPTDIRATLMLIDALRRQDKADEARTIIRAVDENVVIGSDFERIQLAMQLRESGESARSLSLGYEVASNARDNEAVVSVYPNLILLNNAVGEVIGNGTTIAPGDWFELEGIDCQDVSGLIQDTSTPEVTSYAPTQTLAKAILGRKVGDEVVISPGLGADRRYRVKTIRHRYIWLLNDIMASHATRFPEATSMGEMSVKDGDIEPVFDIIRKGDEHNKAILATYVQLMPPLQALARANNKSVLEIAEIIVAQGGEIQTCAGVIEERSEAERFVRKAQQKGAALDTLTAWIAYQLELLPALQRFFGRLGISQATFDELLSNRSRAEANRGQEYMTLGLEGDQKVRTVHSTEETEARIEIFTKAVESIKKHCEILPIDGNDDLANSKLEHVGLIANLLEPQHLAMQHKLLLISDDMYQRLLGLRFGQRRMAWLQIVSEVLMKKGEITREQYARVVGLLAGRKHNHLSLDARVLIDLVQMDERTGSKLYDAAIEFIACPNADMRTHIAAVASFMHQVWGSQLPSWKAGNAVSKLLSRLVARDAERWNITLSSLYNLLSISGQTIVGQHDLARSYLLGWISGHFLTPELDRRAQKARRARGGGRREGRRSPLR